MKKLLFSLVAIVLISFNGNAQKPTKEEARVYAAKVLINFKNTLEPVYAKSTSLDNFIKNATQGYPTSPMPTQGKKLLEVTYNYLANKTSDANIIATYSGKEVAEAFKYLKDNPEKLQSEVFGFKATNEASSEPYPCRWWQLRCHLVEIVGETAADAIITALLVLLI